MSQNSKTYEETGTVRPVNGNCWIPTMAYVDERASRPEPRLQLRACMVDRDGRKIFHRP